MGFNAPTQAGLFGSHSLGIRDALRMAGALEPMHHHRWPSFFLNWDTGGKSPHIHYRQPGGIVRDSPGKEEPIHAERWTIHWMKPEPMHAIETIDSDPPKPGEPPLLRVEIKIGK
jgi:hypothetical protein